MAELFIVIVGIGICFYICGFAGRIFKTDDKTIDDEYKKNHQEYGSALFGLLKPFIAFAIAMVIVIIYIIIDISR